MQDGWKVVTGDPDAPGGLSIVLPRASIVRVTPGRVCLGWQPRWGLWVVYRDRRGVLRRLSPSFYGSAACRAVYDLLTRQAGMGTAA